MKYFLTLCLLSLAISATTPALAREQIRIVGSSTVYPFSTVVAESFGRSSDFKTPIVESTGTGGGFKLLCAGAGESHPDFSGASRAIKQSEIDLCAQNGLKAPIEITVGIDGIVLANTTERDPFKLTLKQLFLALAKNIPENGKLIENPYKKWNEIDPNLPDQTIEVYGPPPTSGTRDAFIELAMHHVCLADPIYKSSYPDKKLRKKACGTIREDGVFIEAGENDNLIVQKLVNNPNALGLFGYSFLEQNGDKVQGAYIDGVTPEFEHIGDGSYPLARPLFLYAKREHVGKIPGMKEFIEELVSDKAAGEEGYLSLKGLVPLPEEELHTTRKHILSDITP